MYLLKAQNTDNKRAAEGIEFPTRKSARLYAKKVREGHELWFLTDPSGDTELLQFNSPGENENGTVA